MGDVTIIGWLLLCGGWGLALGLYSHIVDRRAADRKFLAEIAVVCRDAAKNVKPAPEEAITMLAYLGGKIDGRRMRS